MGNSSVKSGASLVLAAILAGCAADRITAPVSQPNGAVADVAPAPVIVTPAPRACPRIPDHIRAAARTRLAVPDMERRGTMAGEALVSDIEKTRALGDLIALYERCRK